MFVHSSNGHRSESSLPRVRGVSVRVFESLQRVRVLDAGHVAQLLASVRRLDGSTDDFPRLGFRELVHEEDFARTERLTEFLADLLEWVLEGYLEAFERIEERLEELDARAMVDRLDDPEAALQQLVALRREIGRLRRALVSHRQMFLALTRPELAGMSSDATAERFATLRSRLEDVVQAARDSRDSVVGSFDVLIARTGHRTNEIMKVLTLASVLLLPGALIAGVLGMNFRVGFFAHAWLFWLVLVVMAGIALATLAAARLRRWI